MEEALKKKLFKISIKYEFSSFKVILNVCISISITV